MPALRIALICHAGERINRELVAGWLGSFATLVAIVVIQEERAVQIRRVRSEYRRVGFWRLLDVLAFRLYYRIFLAAADAEWERAEIARRRAAWTDVAGDCPVIVAKDPNDAAVVRFLEEQKPDMIVARCKWLLKKTVYGVPALGTYVLHPGICPQYRNSHGCFWALASGDLENVGLTLLRIDDGIDTGPIYGFFRYAFDPSRESHVRIQHRMVLENLDEIRDRLLEVAARRAVVKSSVGKPSRNWGQPWLSAYLRWRRAARRSAS